MMSRTAEIKLKVELDHDDLPTRIEWQASESDADGPTPCQSMMLSMFDSDRKSIASIDLWTKDTTIEDMNLYFFQVFHKLAETYQRATRNADVANLIHEFGNGFGESLGVIVKSDQVDAGVSGGAS